MTEDENDKSPENEGNEGSGMNENDEDTHTSSNNSKSNPDHAHDDDDVDKISDDEDEAAINRMLAIQEEQDQLHEDGDGENGNNNNANGADGGNGNDDPNFQIPGLGGDQAAGAGAGQDQGGGMGGADNNGHQGIGMNNNNNGSRRSFIRLHYTSLSFLLAIVHIIYVLRTRKQAYLALLYLTSSKLSYIIMGNVAIAGVIGIFFQTIQTFLNGLRLMETETIIDHIRWNVTETCIALTMFRQEINVKIMGIFLILILGKCLHWAVELRESHLRMTEEVFYLLDDEDEDALLFGAGGLQNPNDDDNSEDGENANADGGNEPVWWLWRGLGFFLPKSVGDVAYKVHRGIPRVRQKHFKLFTLMSILYLFDVLALTYCVSHILEDGPSVFIMFIFESSILMASIMSTSALFMIHVYDSMLNMMQKIIVERKHPIYGGDNPEDDYEDDTGAVAVMDENPGVDQGESGGNSDGDRNRRGRRQPTMASKLVQRLASVWRDQRVTVTFIIELMALAAKFLFHLILFVVVFTLYGLPINIIRDFYLAFRKLRERLLAFASYRRLTSNMDTRFESVTTEEELDASGRICIICRDTMELDGMHGDLKKLPICEHVFHKHCLKEWLVQQQSCPTCRADLLANEARARVLKKDKENEEKKLKEEEEETARRDAAEAAATKERVVENAQSPKKKRLPPRPCLFQVNANAGTSLFDITPKTNSEMKHATRAPKKTLTKGTIVVCIDAGVFTCAEEASGEYETNIYLKTPGGWVLNDDAEHVMELKPRSPPSSGSSKMTTSPPMAMVASNA